MTENTYTLSRQRRWQLQHKKEGLCHLCSSPAAPGKLHCEKHQEIRTAQEKARYLAKCGGVRKNKEYAPHGMGKILRLEAAIAKHKEWIARYEAQLKELKAKQS
jgi:hypothetical protein